MALILVKPPAPIHRPTGLVYEGMVPYADLNPGSPPPFLIPHCAKCNIGVEKFTIDWVSSPWTLPIQFQCHGKTGGMKVPYSEVMRASREGTALMVFSETKVSNGFRRVYKP